MTFEEFKNHVATHLKDYLHPAEKYADAQVRIWPTMKVADDGERTAVSVIPKPKGTGVAPVIYLEEAYAELTDDNLNQIMADIAAILTRTTSPIPQGVVDAILSYASAKSHIRVRLASTETQGRYLERTDPPRTTVLDTDLVQTFYVEISQDSNLAVTQKLMEIWGVTIMDLIMAATTAETARDYKIEQLTGFGGSAPAPRPNAFPCGPTGEPIMYTVVSSLGSDCGAYGVLMPEIRNQLLEMFEDGYYLLLPNIDYPLIIPYAPSIGITDLQEFASDFFSRCDQEHRLSKHVYRVDREGRLSTFA